MKKIISIMLALLMIASAAIAMSSCSNEEEEDTLIVGYTIYAPMNYEENGKLVGFDTELAEAVAKKLDMEIKFEKIEWKNKYIELNSGYVNCLWNGFTSNCADDDGVQRSEKVDFSYAYMVNSQCVVVNKTDLETLNTKDALKDKKGAAEDGSAGAGAVEAIVSDKNNFVAKDAQSDALLELKSGYVDFAIIDLTMAKTIVGKGDYADLAIAESITLEAEEYSIGFKKGSPLKDKVNGALKELAEDGTMMSLAKKYGLENYVITDFD